MVWQVTESEAIPKGCFQVDAHKQIQPINGIEGALTRPTGSDSLKIRPCHFRGLYGGPRTKKHVVWTKLNLAPRTYLRLTKGKNVGKHKLVLLGQPGCRVFSSPTYERDTFIVSTNRYAHAYRNAASAYWQGTKNALHQKLRGRLWAARLLFLKGILFAGPFDESKDQHNEGNFFSVKDHP